MKTNFKSYLIPGAMACGIMGILVASILLLGVMVVAPTSAQKADTVSQGKTIPIDSASVLSPTDSLINLVNEKAKKTGANFNKVETGVSRVDTKLNKLQIRQERILRIISPIDLPVLAQNPKPPKEIQVSPDTPQIKPVEPIRKNWWKRAFDRNE